jgi:CrcB protein
VTDAADPALPVDSDLDAADNPIGQPRPVHLSWPDIGLVAAGGTVGTGLRYLITTAIPTRAGLPVATLGINIVGAFLLGALLELLADRGIRAALSRRLRLLIGTGGLGGFTTYSALATDTATLIATHPARAVGYALTTVIIGAIASVAGIWLSRRHLRTLVTKTGDR